MKVVQSLGWYFPENTGGSEVYVASLVAQLRELEVESTVAAPVNGDSEFLGVQDGIAVYRYPVKPGRSGAQIAGRTPHSGFELFSRWISQQSASIYHQHSWTFGCGLHHLQAARASGKRTVLTIHVPGPICLRGTMLRNGLATCDGVVTPSGCASCWLQSRGMSSVGRAALSRIPTSIGAMFRPMGRAGTALAATALVHDHYNRLLAAAQCADHVVAVCQWLYEALRANGIPSGKLSLNRQGVTRAPAIGRAAAKRRAGRGHSGPLVVGFLGRWDPVKGVGMLVEAMLRVPEHCLIELHMHAPEASDPDMASHMREMRQKVASHQRIKMGAGLLPEQVSAFLDTIDVLAVPSQWLETGPLVVLEAFAAGVPVLGSDLGGIRELVKDGFNGRLLRHDAPADWARAFCDLAESPETLEHWRSGIGPVRTMREVAAQTRQVYFDLLEGAH